MKQETIHDLGAALIKALTETRPSKPSFQEANLMLCNVIEDYLEPEDAAAHAFLDDVRAWLEDGNYAS